MKKMAWLLAVLFLTFLWLQPTRAVGLEVRQLPVSPHLRPYLILLGVDEETGVKFWRYSQDPANLCWFSKGGFDYSAKPLSQSEIIGELPGSISVADDKMAHFIVKKAAEMALKKCPPPREFADIEVKLLPEGYKVRSQPEHDNFWFEPIYVKAIFHREMVGSTSANRYGPYKLTLFENYAKVKEQARLGNEQRQKHKEEAARKHDEFVKKNGIEEFPGWNKLVANPFAYEGKTISIMADFVEMKTATEGYFSWGSNIAVVSKIPKGMFTNAMRVLLACKVLGKTEAQLPMAGKVMVPHLKFVDAHFCKDRRCSEIVILK